MAGNKQTAAQIKAMHRTQPKMIMVVDGLTGKRHMEVLEISDVERERRMAAA
jgi:phage regulator Rha-like protein